MSTPTPTLATVRTATFRGVTGVPLTVECHIVPGTFPSFDVVGHASDAGDRVRAAVLSQGFTWPPHRITINISPSASTLYGAGLDAAVAYAVLVASGQAEAMLDDVAVVAGLNLDGSLLPVKGVLPMAEALAVAGVRDVLVAGMQDLPDDGDSWPLFSRAIDLEDLAGISPDLSQAEAWVLHGLEVAAVAGLDVLFVDADGSTTPADLELLAGLVADLSGPVDGGMMREVALIRSAVLLEYLDQDARRPVVWVSPADSAVSVLGGASNRMQPGAVTLAHGGVLFTPELDRFASHILNGVVGAHERNEITLTRGHNTTTLPSAFQWVASTADPMRVPARVTASFGVRLDVSGVDVGNIVEHAKTSRNIVTAPTSPCCRSFRRGQCAIPTRF